MKYIFLKLVFILTHPLLATWSIPTDPPESDGVSRPPKRPREDVEKESVGEEEENFHDVRILTFCDVSF